MSHESKGGSTHEGFMATHEGFTFGGTVYFCDGSNIKTMKTSGGGTQTLLTIKAVRIALDRTNGHIYYTVFEVGGVNSAIRRCDLDGDNDTEIYDTGVVGIAIPGIDVDISNEHIYYTYDEKVWRVDYDGTNNTELIDRSGITREGSFLKLNTTTDELFWTEFTSPSGGAMWLMKANTDGSGVTQLYTETASFLSAGGVDVDEDAGKVYWGKSGISSEGMHRADLDGTNEESIYTAESVGAISISPSASLAYVNTSATLNFGTISFGGTYNGIAAVSLTDLELY